MNNKKSFRIAKRIPTDNNQERSVCSMKINKFCDILPIAVQNDTAMMIENAELTGEPYMIKYVAFDNTSTSTDISELEIYDSAEEIRDEYDNSESYFESYMNSIYDHLNIIDDIKQVIDDNICITLCGWSKETLAQRAKNENISFAAKLTHEMQTDDEPFYKKTRTLLQCFDGMTQDKRDAVIAALTSLPNEKELYGEGAPLVYTDASHHYHIVLVQDENNIRYEIHDQSMQISELAKKHYAAVKDAIDDVKTFKEWLPISEKIDKYAQNELRYDTDAITHEGWEHIEKIAPGICYKNLRDSFGAPNDITDDDIEEYYNNALAETKYKLRCSD